MVRSSKYILLAALMSLLHAEPNNVVNISDLDFNASAAIAFLNSESFLLSGNYTLITSQKDDTANSNELKILIETLITAIENYKETLEHKKNDPSYNRSIETIFNFITFMIGHIYWNVLEVNYDVYRYGDNGWNKSIDKEIEKKCAVDPKEHNNVSISIYNKGKYNLLHAVNNDEILCNLVKVVQYQELKRHEQLNLVRIEYINWFYKIFGQTEKTHALIERIHGRVYELFTYHHKRYLLDQMIRFNA